MKGFIKNHPVITVLLCMLLTVALTGIVSLRTNNFNDPQDLFTRDLNPNNLLQPGEDGNYTLVDAKHTAEGLHITPASNGSIKIEGTNETLTGEYNEVPVAQLTLQPGTYTLSSGYKSASTATAYLVAEYNGTTVEGDFDDALGSFTLDAETEVTISLRICPASNWNVTMYPVLVKGDTAGSFYK